MFAIELTGLLLLAAPTEVAVPRALAERTSPPELSGVVWSVARRRYLTVSDDTGLEKRGNRHAPWVFELDEQGALQAEPLVIAGLTELNDAESITAGPEGTFFLTTSHSPDHKGRVKESRCQLLWLSLENGHLAVKGRLNLLAVRDEKGRSLAELASGEAGAIDVEAVSWREHALYVGLKAPLGPGGEAALFRLGDVEAAFGAGAVKPECVEKLATLKLSVADASGAERHQGISDLTFGPDGAVWLTANAPKGAPADGGGALWRWEPRSQKLSLAQRFWGLKPEGVTPSADGKSLVVVFDRGEESPQWARIALAW